MLDLSPLPDDPYYLLYYGPTPRPSSYFSLEATEGDGRTGLVLRFDSLSKVVSSGLRIGFTSGPASILEKMNLFVRVLVNILTTPDLRLILSTFIVPHRWLNYASPVRLHQRTSNLRRSLNPSHTLSSSSGEPKDLSITAVLSQPFTNSVRTFSRLR